MITLDRVIFDFPMSTIDLVQLLAEALGLNYQTCTTWGSYTETYLLYSKAPDATNSTGICVGAYTSGSNHYLQIALMYNESISSGKVITVNTSTTKQYALCYKLGVDGGAFAINEITASDKSRGITCMFGKGGNYGMYAVKSSNDIECVCNGVKFNKSVTNSAYSESDIVAVSPFIHMSTEVVSDNLYVTHNFPYVSESAYFALENNEFITMFGASGNYERLALKLK